MYILNSRWLWWNYANTALFKSIVYLDTLALWDWKNQAEPLHFPQKLRFELQQNYSVKLSETLHLNEVLI
jgi:hypothetical protein